jgi:hypothetical protein
MIRRMTKSATVTPMHNITAAIDAAEEKASEVSRRRTIEGRESYFALSTALQF